MYIRRFFSFILGLFLPLFICAQEEVLTNQSILDMLELGFTNDVIVGKIETSKSSFDTTVDALKVLKEKGVGNEVIIAMMHSHKAEQDKGNEAKVKKTGIYVKSGDNLQKIYPTVFSGSKTNTLGAALSYGLADAKIKSTLNGEHSQNLVHSNSPEFYFYFDLSQTSELSLRATSWWFSVASSPNEFVLVKLKSKGRKREMDIGTVNLYAGNSVGVDGKNVIKFDIEVISDNEFKVIPAWLLEPGEYCFYYQGIVPVGGYSNQAVFDFSIPDNLELAKVKGLYRKGAYVWILKEGEPKQFLIEECKQGREGFYYGLRKGNTASSEADFFVRESECYKSKKELKKALGLD